MKPQKRSSKCEVVNLSISFNILDPDQKRLFEHAKTFINFSAAAKRWLENSMNGSHTRLIRHMAETERVEVDSTERSPEDTAAQKVEFDPIAALF